MSEDQEQRRGLSLPLPSNVAVWKRVVGADPAAGAEVGDAVPAGKWWVVVAVRVVLVQGLTQTPQPILTVDDGNTANVVWEGFGASAAQAVSTTCAYVWAPGHPAPGGIVGATVNGHAVAPLPADLMLPAGFRIRTNTLGIGANSDYAAPSYYVCELG